jgi:hypothetical protein
MNATDAQQQKRGIVVSAKSLESFMENRQDPGWLPSARVDPLISSGRGLTLFCCAPRDPTGLFLLF